MAIDSAGVRPIEPLWLRLRAGLIEVSRGRGRLAGRRAAVATAAACLWVAAAACLGLLAAGVAPAAGWTVASGLTAAVACALAWTAGYGLGKPPLVRAAMMLDQCLGSEDLFATAAGCGVSRDDTPFARFVTRAAVAKLANVPRRGPGSPLARLSSPAGRAAGRWRAPELMALCSGGITFALVVAACLLTGWGARWATPQTAPLAALNRLEREARSLERSSQGEGLDAVSDAVSRLGELARRAAGGLILPEQALEELDGLSAYVRARSFALAGSGTEDRAWPAGAQRPGSGGPRDRDREGASEEDRPLGGGDDRSGEAGATRNFAEQELRRAVSTLSAGDVAASDLRELARDLSRAAADQLLPGDVRSELKRAADLLEQGRLDEARELLEKLEQRMAAGLGRPADQATQDTAPGGGSPEAGADARRKEQALLKRAEDLLRRTRESLEDLRRAQQRASGRPEDEDALAYSRRKTEGATGSERQKAGVVPSPPGGSDDRGEGGRPRGGQLAQGQAAPGTEEDTPREAPWQRPDLPRENQTWVQGRLGQGPTEAVVASVRAPNTVDLVRGSAGRRSSGQEAADSEERALEREDVPAYYTDVVRDYFSALSSGE